MVLFFFIAWTQANTVYTESLRILPDVGVVLTATSPSGFATSHFLDWEHVGPVIINEVSDPLLLLHLAPPHLPATTYNRPCFPVVYSTVHC